MHSHTRTHAHPSCPIACRAQAIAEQTAAHHRMLEAGQREILAHQQHAAAHPAPHHEQHHAGGHSGRDRATTVPIDAEDRGHEGHLDEAAVRVQAAVRGHQGRQEVREMKDELLEQVGRGAGGGGQLGSIAGGLVGWGILGQLRSRD